MKAQEKISRLIAAVEALMIENREDGLEWAAIRKELVELETVTMLYETLGELRDAAKKSRFN